MVKAIARQKVQIRMCNKKTKSGKHALKSTIQSMTFLAESRQCAMGVSYNLNIIIHKPFYIYRKLRYNDFKGIYNLTVRILPHESLSYSSSWTFCCFILLAVLSR